MKTRFQHTVLALVTSHNSGGRAQVVYGHPTVDSSSWSDPFLTSQHFKRVPVDQLAVVNLRISGRRRFVTMATLASEQGIGGTIDFVYKYQTERLRQWNRYDSVNATNFAEKLHNMIERANRYYDDEAVEVEEEPTIEVTDDLDDRDIYIDPTDEKLFETIKSISAYRHVAMMMIGPSGYGKTSIPEQKAKDWKMDFLRWDCATVRDPEEFFGYRGAQDGSTVDKDGKTIFTPSLFTKKIEAGNVVVVLDELNRIDPYISNILFPLLDHAGKTEVAGHNVEVGPNTIFVATVNIGFQFTGTFTLDTALTNRFTAKVLVGPLPNEVEITLLSKRVGLDLDKAIRIVKIMSALRTLNEEGKISCDASTRVSLQVSELVSSGLDIKTSMTYVVLNSLTDEEAKSAVDAINLEMR